MKQGTILVVGASGMVGSELVDLLRQQDQDVREATSKPASGKSGKVHLNLVTGEGLKDAFEGVDRAFFLSPPGYADHYQILSPLIQEAKRRGLKKTVLMTAMGANAVETTPFRRAEIELEKSGLNYNIIRPNWFYQNFTTFWIQSIRASGEILLPAGQAKVSFIDARDISAVAARLLTSDAHNNQAFDLTGPEAVDHSAVAKALSTVADKKIVYREISPESLRERLLAAGLPADYTEFLLVILAFLREGYNAHLTASVRDLLGREARGLQTFVQDYKQAWS